MTGTTRIGLSGTGFIAKGVSRLIIKHHADLKLSRTLTRRQISSITDYPSPDVLTNSVQELIEHADLIIECSGDVVHATDVVAAALEAGLPVVTMNSEFHVTTGSYFADRGLLTEAEGDQPGCLAALHEEAVQMGFKPQVYANLKGYLNHDPKPEDMEHWAKKQGFSLDQTTSFTDGTKLQIEQAFIANGMGATISKQGMEGYRADDTASAAKALGAIAEEIGSPIADYIVSAGQPPGVLVTATHDATEQGPLENIKMGEGPYYVLMKNYHLCAIEIVKTVRRVLDGGGILLNNGAEPQISVAAIAKKPLKKGQHIKRGIGSFDLRGEVIQVKDDTGHVPIGILQHTTITRDLAPGQILTCDDVEIPESLAATAVHEIFRRREHS